MLQAVGRQVDADGADASISDGDEAAQQALIDKLVASSTSLDAPESSIRLPSNAEADSFRGEGSIPPPVAPVPARGGGLRVRRGGAPLLGLVFFFAFCAMGEAARGEGFGFTSAFAGAPYALVSIFDGLPDDMVESVEQIVDNRLASSSWRKVEAALNHWRPFADTVSPPHYGKS